MRPLQNILDINQFTSLLKEGKKDPHADCPWWDDCISSVIISLCSDRMTTRDNLYQKAMEAALNFLSTSQAVSLADKEHLAKEIAEIVEDKLKDSGFSNKMLANLEAERQRNNVSEEPENRFVKLA